MQEGLLRNRDRSGEVPKELVNQLLEQRDNAVEESKQEPHQVDMVDRDTGSQN